MYLQIRPLTFLILIFTQLTSGIYAMEGEEDKIAKIPSQLRSAYKRLNDKDKKQIDEMYRENPTANTLTFLSCPGLNAEYNKALIQCIDKENNFIRKLILSHLMGKVTFESFFPILPRYSCLKTLDSVVTRH